MLKLHACAVTRCMSSSVSQISKVVQPFCQVLSSRQENKSWGSNFAKVYPRHGDKTIQVEWLKLYNIVLHYAARA